jgi:hypothetical protein
MSRLTEFRKRHRHVRLPILVREERCCCDTTCPWFPARGNECHLFGELEPADAGGYRRHRDCRELEV